VDLTAEIKIFENVLSLFGALYAKGALPIELKWQYRKEWTKSPPGNLQQPGRRRLFYCYEYSRILV